MNSVKTHTKKSPNLALQCEENRDSKKHGQCKSNAKLLERTDQMETWRVCVKKVNRGLERHPRG